ncbi:hypothetical protein JF50_13505 [Pseudoalteromonas luteoviolacea]|uniref:Bacteriocin n=1 Tax=Pseudoalteromonas luteoviolacea TaxID=43657 RepID=A0A0C1QBW6_9GAMM|nr:hypothetical protein [Pseudoalteromonas luteoviolacea]KID56900.1 hypothetical protein JF50_13505 [Pseudoalteromonas luteoviolacea]
MRELNVREVQQVSGGDALRGFNWGAAIGTVGGAVWTGSSAGATRGGVIGGALGFSFGFGYGVGTVLYKFATR